MAGTKVDLERAKERFRQAADQFGSHAFDSLLNGSPVKTAAIIGGAAVLGILLGRSRRFTDLLKLAVPAVIQLAKESQESGKG